MKRSSTSELNTSNQRDSSITGTTDQISNQSDLSSDPEYAQLLDNYQNAEFTRCSEILETLENRYPGNRSLQDFKENLNIQLSLQNMAAVNKKGEKRKKKFTILKMIAFTLIGFTIVFITATITYQYLNDIVSTNQLEVQTTQLTSLYAQAEQLLNVAKPQPAAEIIEKIRLINPDFDNLSELTSRTDRLLLLEAKYLTALEMIEENRDTEALVLLQEIDAEQPGMWDVSQRIASIETSHQIAEALEAGNAAYLAENWGQVISAYETVMRLDPKLDDPQMKEQLLKGYLNKIIRLLQNDTFSIEDIEAAEQYYRKAVALIPQSREFASERENLQEVSSNLLEVKFTQIAKANLADKNQTASSIARAVSFLRKAANINPRNNALQLDLKNAEFYQIGFQNFIEMNWAPAITHFNQILSSDTNFANGNASLLLFEAYYALGNQYYSAGFYQDARRYFEQAEILAWDDSENLLKLFQVQIRLGDTFAKLDDDETAVSYYQYALSAIQIVPRLTNYPAIESKLAEANNLAANGSYESAVSAYQEALTGIDVVYTISELEINDNACLALFANEHSSTVEAILAANDLPKSMVITFGRTLKVPMIEN